MARPERVFTLRELTRLLRLTPKRAGQLKRLGLLRGDAAGYRFRELVAGRAGPAPRRAGPPAPPPPPGGAPPGGAGCARRPGGPGASPPTLKRRWQSSGWW